MTRHGDLVRAGMSGMSVDVTVIRGLLQDAFEEAKAAYRADQPETVIMSSEGAHVKAAYDHTKPLRYHRLHCGHMHIPQHWRAEVDLPVAKFLRLTPCAFCQDLTLKHWAKELGIDHTTIWYIMTGKRSTIRKTLAVRLLQAIGEPPHPSLLEDVKTYNARRAA